MITSNILFLLLSVFSVCNCKRLICKPVMCPPCRRQLNETVEQSQRFILEAQGPSDGSCEKGQKWIYYGEDYGLDNNACCCIPVPDFPPIQCDPLGPGVTFCPLSPAYYKDETIGEFYLRIGRLLGKSAPSNGCCRSNTFRYIFPPEITAQSADICACIEENMRVEEKPCSSSSSSSERRH